MSGANRVVPVSIGLSSEKLRNRVSPSLSFGAAFRISVIRVTTKLRRIAMLNLAIYITDGIGVP